MRDTDDEAFLTALERRTAGSSTVTWGSACCNSITKRKADEKERETVAYLPVIDSSADNDRVWANRRMFPYFWHIAGGGARLFFAEGNIAYYRCEDCGRLFDEEKKQVESIAVPVRSAEMSVCINGAPIHLTMTQQSPEQIHWSSEKPRLTKGDVITVYDEKM